eukprot:m.122898 g.122898  ORF g.122898 m.122898 type:complete len:350 (+) comp11122_c0_seq11:510-1559(+)
MQLPMSVLRASYSSCETTFSHRRVKLCVFSLQVPHEHTVWSPFAQGHNGSIAVTGGTTSARGPLYAVNHVLRALGFEWFAHDVVRVPSALPDSLPPTLLSRYIPALEYRQQYEFQCLATDPVGKQYAKFESHLGQNRGSKTLAADPRFGGTLEYALDFVHTSYDVLAYPAPASRVPPAHLWESHREWFWPQDDNGSATYGQLCWSDPSLQAYLISQVRRILTDLPNATILSVSQNDNQNYCKTPAELAIIEEEGTPGGAMFRTINMIADAVADDFPNVAIDTLAYQWSRPAPNVTVPRKNVIIRLCCALNVTLSLLSGIQHCCISTVGSFIVNMYVLSLCSVAMSRQLT